MKSLNKIPWGNISTVIAACALINTACASKKMLWRHLGDILPEWAGIPTETTQIFGIPDNGVPWSQRTSIGKLAMLKDVAWRMAPNSRLVINGDDVHISSGTGEWWGAQLGATIGLRTATAHNNSTIDALLDIFPKSIDREELLQNIFRRDSAEGLRGQDINGMGVEQVLELAKEYFIVISNEWNTTAAGSAQTEEMKKKLLIDAAARMQAKSEEGKSFVLVIAGNECFLCLETEDANNEATHEALLDVVFNPTQKNTRSKLLRTIHEDDQVTDITTLSKTDINLDVLKSFIESELGLGVNLLF